MNGSTEFSALVSCRGSAGSGPPGAEDLARVVDSLPGTDKWAQYPDASGRGKAVEFRFWIEAPDSAAAAAAATRLVSNGLESVGLGTWVPERVHTATPAERVLETVRGIAQRLDDPVAWSVLVRVVVPVDVECRSSEVEDRVRFRFGIEECDIIDSGSTWEIRVWCRSTDAVAGAEQSVEDVLDILREETGVTWEVVRVHAASAGERDRERYRGVYERP